MKEFKVISFQLQPKSADKEYNLQKIIHNLENQEADLFVLPEFFSTGVCHKSFVEQPENSIGGDTIATLRDLAIKTKTNIICGTVIEKDGEDLFNTTFVLNRKGNIVAKYRKIHLFNMYGGQEDKRITKGKDVVVTLLDIGYVGLSICFDMRFPMHFQELKKIGADFLVCPTAWGFPKNCDAIVDWSSLWSAFNIARANETSLPLISCNQIGYSDSGFYCIGNSMMLDKNGNIVAKAKNSECLIESFVRY